MNHILLALRSSLLALTSSLISLTSYAANLPLAPQRVQLYTGWNVFHLSVAPTGTAEQVFGDFPVTNGVAMYDAESFLRTRQFTDSRSSEGLRDPAVRMWYKDDPGASSFNAPLANTVYLCNATSNYSTVIWGVPEAARLFWHKADTNTVMNYVGPSLDDVPGGVNLADYFRADALGPVKTYRVCGWGETGFEYEYYNDPAVDGEAFAVSCDGAKTWSGPLYVTPRYGLLVDVNHDSQVLSVRNDSDVTQRVQIAVAASEPPGGPRLDPGDSTFFVRDAAIPDAEQVAWTNFNAATPIEFDLPPSETASFEVTADVPSLTADAGGIVTVRTLGAAHMRTAIPLLAERTVRHEEKWPRGLWILNAELDRTTFAESRSNLVHGARAGGTMKLRLPMYVDSYGQATLLQHVDIYSHAEGGTEELYAFAPAVNTNAADVLRRRISSTVLPMAGAQAASVSGQFGTRLVFEFAVDAFAKANPMRHPRHPEHDGLKSDFSSSLPSGDDFSAYSQKEKPELFGVSNTVALVWTDEPGTWTPGGVQKGTIRWAFGGLHHYGELVAEGTFAAQRLSIEKIQVKK